MPTDKFLQLLAEKREREARENAAKAKQAEAEFSSDLVPEASDVQLSQAQLDRDALIKQLPILDVYRRFTKYSTGHIRPGQTESIKLRCPNPQHTDEEPSYSINTNKNTGKCFSCGHGYDAKDIVAFNMGLPFPEYKKSSDFPRVMETLATAFGYRVEKTLGGQEVFWKESGDNSDKSDTPGNPGIHPETGDSRSDLMGKADKSGGEPLERESASPNSDSVNEKSNENDTDADVIELYEGDDHEIKLPSLNWRDVLPGESTFLDLYMEACCKDEVPEEYHLFNALLALGFAAGREVTLKSKLPVYGNLFLCHLGKSGSGKSTSTRHLRVLLKAVYPYDATNPHTKGVISATPSSAEVLIDSFSRPVYDPNNAKQIAYYAPVRGLIDFNEMSGLVGRAARQGNLLKPIMMDFFDMNDEIRSQSRGSGTVVASNPFASCSTTVQPAALKELLREGDDASGFLNRWIFVGGTPKKRTIMGTGEVELDAAKDALENIKGWAGSFVGKDRIEWNEDSLVAMQHFFDEHVYPLAHRSDTNMFVRLDLMCLKLTLLFSMNRMEKVVSVDTVDRVKKMFAYLVSCYGIPVDQVGNSLENEITEAIIYQLKRIGGNDGTTLNILAKALKRKKYPKELILRNLKALIELGFVDERVSQAGTQGRPTKRYAYVV